MASIMGGILRASGRLYDGCTGGANSYGKLRPAGGSSGHHTCAALRTKPSVPGLPAIGPARTTVVENGGLRSVASYRQAVHARFCAPVGARRSWANATKPRMCLWAAFWRKPTRLAGSPFYETQPVMSGLTISSAVP